MRMIVCRLTLHENVFFSTREIGRLYETERYFHNYALTYALGLAQSTYFHAEQVPTYASDLATVNARGIYVTPARPVRVNFQLNTFKYGNNNYHVEMGQTKTNTPTFGRLKELAVGSVFEFAVLVEQDTEVVRLPRWVRLGLWLGKAEVEPVADGQAQATGLSVQQSSYPLNPLDVVGDLIVYDLIPMPPVSLLDGAELNSTGWQIGTPDGPRWLPSGLAYRFGEGA